MTFIILGLTLIVITQIITSVILTECAAQREARKNGRGY